MKYRFATAVVAVSMSLFAAQGALATVPASGSDNSTAPMPVKGKVIGFNLRNDSAAPVTIKAGDQETTVAPGKSASFKLPEGTQVMAVTGTSHIAAGSLLATVSSVLKGNTLAIN